MVPVRSCSSRAMCGSRSADLRRRTRQPTPQLLVVSWGWPCWPPSLLLPVEVLPPPRNLAFAGLISALFLTGVCT